jgi:hypothetical protein
MPHTTEDKQPVYEYKVRWVGSDGTIQQGSLVGANAEHAITEAMRDFDIHRNAITEVERRNFLYYS